ncbi:hypothetical protein [Erythrobacter sp. JK5]|uniref:hypothetical protein n=1 Tax=Erythrobacter sp. JK5 TaxID=2829500 RepID=UPI001BAD4CE1|nr:hypothetical protein [Erythrobacter sp. JK5]QUL38626.1 hypothetical protein KDC96_04350 [Erythrobacter sp. JK5]
MIIPGALLAALVSAPAVYAEEQADVSSWPLYEGVNAFVSSLEKSNRDSASDLVVPMKNGPRGTLKIPEPETVLSTLLGCESYGKKYSRGDFPGVITRWQCGKEHYSLWLRPSYDGQPGKVQLTQFGPYSNAQLHGRDNANGENTDG